MYRKASHGFSSSPLTRFFAASSAGLRRISSFEGVEGAAQNSEKQTCFHILSIFGGLGFACFSCYFNNLALTAPAQPVRS